MSSRLSYFVFLIVMPCLSQQEKYDSSQVFQVAAPRVTVDSVFFGTSSKIDLLFGLPGAYIHYTIDGQQVTENAPLYSSSLILTESATLKARVFHEDYQPSTTTEIQIKQIQHHLNEVEVDVDPEPHSTYAGEGAKTLIDGQKGTLQFQKGKKWLGFKSEIVEVNLQFNHSLQLSKVILSILADQNSWIFTPESASVIVDNKVVGVWNSEDTAQLPAKLSFIEIPMEKKEYSALKIIIKPLEKIPDWHQGKGTLSWLFIDEILVE